jgi:hypothetical protein
MGSFPVISSPSVGHEHIPEVCRIHSAIQGNWIMTLSRLRLCGPTHGYCRISIRLLSAQHVKRGFGQVPSHRTHGLGVTFARPQPRVQLADMPLRAAPVIHRHRIGRFGKRPVACVRSACVPAGMHARRGATIRRQPRESLSEVGLILDSSVVIASERLSPLASRHSPLPWRSPAQPVRMDCLPLT